MSWASFLSVDDPQDGSLKRAVLLQGHDRQVEIYCDFNDNAGTCGISVYGYADGGPAQMLFSTAGTEIEAGTAENGEETVRFFGDTIGTVTSVPATEFTERNGGAANDVASIQFDVRSFKYVLLLVTAISTSDNVRWFIRGIS